MDFGSVVVSVRHRANNDGTLTNEVINRRSRTLFFLINFFLITLVNPIFLEIATAIAVAQLSYRQRTAALVPSIMGVGQVYGSIPLGRAVPVDLDAVAAVLAFGRHPVGHDQRAHRRETG